MPDLAGERRVVKPEWSLAASSRASGRHRDTGQRPALPLIMRDGPEETIHIAFPDRAWQPRGWRHRFASLRRPVLAWVVAAVILGGFALWGVAGPGSGRTTGSAKSPVPLPAMVPAPVSVPASTSRPSAPAAGRKRHPSRRPAAKATGQPTARQPGREQAPPASRPTAHPSASARNNSPAVVVRYVVDGVSGAGFQGEVDVVNNGRLPLAGWQIVVALEGDEVTAVQNAAGFDSNGILLMQPATSTEVVPPDGGRLRVLFAAQGPRTMPLACAFNQVNCQ